MAFHRIATDDKNLQLIQDSVQKAVAGIQSASLTNVTINSDKSQTLAKSQTAYPFTGGTLISIPLSAGQDNLIPHGLNRTPQVWIVMRKDQNSNVWETPTAQIQDGNGRSQSAGILYLNLWCSVSCNVTVWVS